jgi:glycosyltransferase involved in cell wall biosynthesis
MKVALLVGHFPPGAFGGAELQAEQWAVRLARRHDVTVVTRRDHAGQPARELRDGMEVLRTPVSRVPGWRTVENIAATRALIRRMPTRPDVLLCFQTFVSGLAGVITAAHDDIPTVVWIRGELEYLLDASRRSRHISPQVWARAAAVLVQGPANREALLEQLSRRSPAAAHRLASAVHVVPNGIELPERPVTRGARVLVLGRLVAKKGVDVVIEALAGLPDIELVVAGAGPERATLEALAERRGVTASFLGHVPRSRIPELMRSAACLVLASRDGEGFPNVILEAMAHGVPVVATPVAATVDLVEHGSSGLLVPIGDPRALRLALTSLLDDTAQQDRLAKAGRAIAERYSWSRVQPALERILEEAVAGAPLRYTDVRP